MLNNDTLLCDLLPLVIDEQAYVIQAECEMNLNDVLRALGALVAVADISDDHRRYLYKGLCHLGGHIAAETKQLVADMTGKEQ